MLRELERKNAQDDYARLELVSGENQIVGDENSKTYPPISLELSKTLSNKGFRSPSLLKNLEIDE